MQKLTDATILFCILSVIAYALAFVTMKWVNWRNRLKGWFGEKNTPRFTLLTLNISSVGSACIFFIFLSSTTAKQIKNDHLGLELFEYVTSSIIITGILFLLTQLIILCLRNRKLLELRLWSIIYFSLFVIIVYASLYGQFGLQSGETTYYHNTEISLYFSIVTFTTLGYGDFTLPLGTKLYSASQALIGYVLLGLFISTIGDFFKRVK